MNDNAVARILWRKGQEIVRVYDESHRADLEQMARDISATYDVLLARINADPGAPDHVFQAALMNWGSLNTLVAAVELLRLGYSKEPLMLIRNAIETCAVAFVIHTDEAEYKKFLDDPIRYDSPKAISKAKEVVTVIGRTYGLISQYFTHPGPLHTLPHHFDGELFVGGFLKDTNRGRERLAILMMKQSVGSLVMLIEFTLLKIHPSPIYWTAIDEDTFRTNPTGETGLSDLKEMEDLIKTL